MHNNLYKETQLENRNKCMLEYAEHEFFVLSHKVKWMFGSFKYIGYLIFQSDFDEY